MTMSKLASTLQNYPRPCITDAELNTLLGGTADSRYSKVKRMQAQGKLLHIRRGLYCLTDALGYLAKPHPYELAQYIYGPSYISLESALSFHGLIPERVYTVTSVTGKRSKEFKSSLGVFSYMSLPLENFFTDVELVNEKNGRFFIAKPWKAICDYVSCYKKNWNSLEPLLENLRIELNHLPVLHQEEIQRLNDYYHSARIKRFLKGVQRDLNNIFSKNL